MSLLLVLAISNALNAQIRVMSYNIHYAVGMNKENSLQGIANAIKKADPDIVGLQEIADSTMAMELGRLTGMKAVFGPSLGRMNGYGDAILSKYPFVYDGNYSIPSASGSRYEAMCVTVDISSKSTQTPKIRLINTHFDWLKTIGSQQARMAAVDVIEKGFFKNNTIPTVLTGDFNVEPGDEVVAKLKKYGWVNTAGNGSFKTISSTNPTKQIDYVFCRPANAWKIKKFSVINGLLTSDHLPVIADLDIK